MWYYTRVQHNFGTLSLPVDITMVISFHLISLNNIISKCMQHLSNYKKNYSSYYLNSYYRTSKILYLQDIVFPFFQKNSIPIFFCIISLCMKITDLKIYLYVQPLQRMDNPCNPFGASTLHSRMQMVQHP